MTSPFTDDHPLAEKLRNFIADAPFPCVGAKAALARGTINVVIARSIASAWNDLVIHDALMQFVGQYQRNPALFQSCAVIFEGPDTLDEFSFEKHLWDRLQSLSDKDTWRGQPYDDDVSPDPDNPHFALSFAGEGFFVVGLHPNSSRKARQFSQPTMIFNPRRQFEQLRNENRYEKMRAAILERDLNFSGSLNPMLARHGDSSEARQYSGRAVNDEWRCPFQYGDNNRAA